MANREKEIRKDMFIRFRVLTNTTDKRTDALKDMKVLQLIFTMLQLKFFLSDTACLHESGAEQEDDQSYGSLQIRAQELSGAPLVYRILQVLHDCYILPDITKATRQLEKNT